MLLMGDPQGNCAEGGAGRGGCMHFSEFGKIIALFQTQIYDFSYGLNTIINIAVIELY